jgi:hypothetical protein
VAEELFAIHLLLSTGNTEWLKLLSPAGLRVLGGESSVNTILVSIDADGNWWVRDAGTPVELRRVKGSPSDRQVLMNALDSCAMYREIIEFSRGLRSGRDPSVIKQLTSHVGRLRDGSAKDRLLASIGADLLALPEEQRNRWLSDKSVGEDLERALQVSKQVDLARVDAITQGAVPVKEDPAYLESLFAHLTGSTGSDVTWMPVSEDTYVADAQSGIRWYAKTDKLLGTTGSFVSGSEFVKLTKEGKISVYYGSAKASELYRIGLPDEWAYSGEAKANIPVPGIPVVQF